MIFKDKKTTFLHTSSYSGSIIVEKTKENIKGYLAIIKA